MFGLSRDEKLSKKLEDTLRQQINMALEDSGTDEVNNKLNTGFLRGYILSLTAKFAEEQGKNGELFLDRNLLKILKKVTPDSRLLQLIIKLGAQLELAEGGESEIQKSFVENYEMGVIEGEYDARIFVTFGSDLMVGGLYRYLANKTAVGKFEPAEEAIAEDDISQVSKVTVIIAKILDESWATFCNQTGAVTSRKIKIGFAKFRHGVIDAASQFLNVEEEVWFRMIAATNALQNKFALTDEENAIFQKELMEEIEKELVSKWSLRGGQIFSRLTIPDNLEKYEPKTSEIALIVDALLQLADMSEPEKSGLSSGYTLSPKEIEMHETKSTENHDSIEENLKLIKNLLEKGLITEDQADLKRRKLLSQL